MAERKLNERQLMFCKEYIVDLNGTAAAIRAGYKEHTARITASKLLTKANIQAEIQRLMSKRAKKVEISAEDVLESILSIRDTCTKGIPVISKVTGEQIGESMTDIGGALKANELLGKHLKLFTDKVEVESKGELNINFNIPRPKKEK